MKLADGTRVALRMGVTREMWNGFGLGTKYGEEYTVVGEGRYRNSDCYRILKGDEDFVFHIPKVWVQPVKRNEVVLEVDRG